ncbi:tetratricopeptide repeat protein [Peristeroidobacter soli]|uniref:tetratricopeptide repeat protein n=1 Tax=Peristeroidobacter soli TaxID=2497877 RepID=UPI00101DA233|nr:SEL1-like repeat protein [Peristeroidobacter soli]
MRWIAPVKVLIVCGAVIYGCLQPALADVNAGVRAFRAKDYPSAWTQLFEPAQRGDPVAQTHIGMMLAMGARGGPDMPGAVSWYRKAVAQNYGPAMSQLGMMYVMGMGVRQDFKQAAELFQRGVQAGNKESMTNLAQLYETGQGVQRDPVRARQLREQASGRGEKVAAEQLREDARSPGAAEFRQATTLRSTRQYSQSRQFAQQAAAKGNVEDMVLAGRQAIIGEGGAKDYAAALRYSEQAARAGNRDGMFQVGYLYEFGLGVRLDKKTALSWYDKAAARGNLVARQAATNLRSADYEPAPAPAGNSDELQARERKYLGAGGQFNGLTCVKIDSGGQSMPCSNGMFGNYSCP